MSDALGTPEVRAIRGSMLAPVIDMKSMIDRLRSEDGVAGYMLLWLMGVPASILFVIFLLRGCN